MSEAVDKEQDKFHVMLNELYLARKVALELLRDCSTHTSARIENAFMLEIVTLLYRKGIKIEDEMIRMKKEGNDEIASSLEAFSLSRVSKILRQSIILPESTSVGAELDL